MTCSGCRPLSFGRVRCGTHGRGAMRLRPAPTRAPPRRGNVNSACRFDFVITSLAWTLDLALGHCFSGRNRRAFEPVHSTAFLRAFDWADALVDERAFNLAVTNRATHAPRVSTRDTTEHHLAHASWFLSEPSITGLALDSRRARTRVDWADIRDGHHVVSAHHRAGAPSPRARGATRPNERARSRAPRSTPHVRHTPTSTAPHAPARSSTAAATPPRSSRRRSPGTTARCPAAGRSARCSPRGATAPPSRRSTSP